MSNIQNSFSPPFTFTHSLSLRDIALLLLTLFLLYSLLSYFLRHSTAYTPLSGPAPHSFFFGSRKLVVTASDPGLLYEKWAEQHGSVYRIQDALGTSSVVLTDPRAIAHFYERETVGYVHSSASKRGFEGLVSWSGNL
jgi:hypothetical protein